MITSRMWLGTSTSTRIDDSDMIDTDSDTI